MVFSLHTSQISLQAKMVLGVAGNNPGEDTVGQEGYGNDILSSLSLQPSWDG